MQLLSENGIEFETIEYLKQPPTADELDTICHALDLEPLALMRTKESRFDELGLSIHDQRSRSEWLNLMIQNPILIERPIVVLGGRAVVGRPPEKVQELLEEI